MPFSQLASLQQKTKLPPNAAKIKELHDQGLSVKEIAEHMGLSYGNVYHHMRTHKIREKGRSVAPFSAQELYDAYVETKGRGLSGVMANRYGVTKSVLYYYLKRDYGVTRVSDFADKFKNGATRGQR